MLRDISNAASTPDRRSFTHLLVCTPESVRREETAIRERLRAELASIPPLPLPCVEGGEDGDGAAGNGLAVESASLPASCAGPVATVGQAVERIRVELGLHAGIPTRTLIDMAKCELGCELESSNTLRQDVSGLCSELGIAWDDAVEPPAPTSSSETELHDGGLAEIEETPDKQMRSRRRSAFLQDLQDLPPNSAEKFLQAEASLPPADEAPSSAGDWADLPAAAPSPPLLWASLQQPQAAAQARQPTAQPDLRREASVATR